MLNLRSALFVVIAAVFSIPVSGCAWLTSQGDTAAAVGDARQGMSMDDMMAAWGDAGAVGEKHEILEQLAGTWDTTGKFWMHPGARPEEATGESTKTLVLGGRFLREEYRSTSPEMPFEGIGYTGYDNIKKKYIGSWIDSMTTFMFTSEATPTGDGFEGSGLMYDPITKLRYDSRFKVTIAGNDAHKLEYWEPGPGGKYYLGMQMVYTRRDPSR